jgi:hypothetical protein
MAGLRCWFFSTDNPPVAESSDGVWWSTDQSQFSNIGADNLVWWDITSAKTGEGAWTTYHNYYTSLHINLLVIYIIWIISRLTCISVDYNYFYVSKMKDLFTQPLLAQSFAQPKRPPKVHSQSLKDILHQFGPITNVSYEPFQYEQPRQTAKAVLPTSFPSNPSPFDYFSLYFTHDLFQTITTNTNQYTNIQRLKSEKTARK